jgi:hypothetical protein
MKSPNEIRAARKKILWIKLFFWALLLGWLPFAALFLTKATAVPLSIAYFLAWLMAGVMQARAKCPVCQRPFHSRPLKNSEGVFSNPYTFSCLNCGQSLLGK